MNFNKRVSIVFIIDNFNNLILIFQTNSSHSALNRVKCEKQILHTRWEFELTTLNFTIFRVECEEFFKKN